MAIVLALVIVGWLVAFALGSQAGFTNEPTVATEQSSVKKVEKVKATASYKKPASAS
ncbi:MAG: hypothetical protein AAGC93_22450 [Cyanobacteria bacterium P01_F01_bin.53]